MERNPLVTQADYCEIAYLITAQCTDNSYREYEMSLVRLELGDLDELEAGDLK